MKLQTLEYFVVLAESHSINEAAQKLYVAQPSLTKALKLFENEIGVPLFARNRSGITLTEAGKKILPEAKQILAYYNGWLGLSKERALQTVDIYIHASFPNFLLPDIVLRFKKLYPDVNINCVVTAIPERYITPDLEKPALAMFICGKSEQLQKYTAVQGNPPIVLFHGEYGCLVNKNSRLAQRSSVTPEDLKSFYLVLPELRMPPDCSPAFLTPILNDIISTVSPHQVLQVESVDSVINLVHNHPEAYALSYYPALNRYEGVANRELIYIPLQSPITHGDFLLFYSKKACDQYPALRELVRSIQEAADRFLEETTRRTPPHT